MTDSKKNKDDSFLTKIKRIFTYPKEREIYYNPRTNYCGPFELQAWITKWIPFHYVFPEINFSCFQHDCRYKILFIDALDQRKNFFTLLVLKLIVDVLFLIEMLKCTAKTPFCAKYPWLITFRTVMAFVFFAIVVICTPFYVWLFSKRHSRQNKNK